ncbi:MAG TPA: hypothetical protein VED01_12715 [Burkholderiales bacterium]|nr:hypothetical protein [Burkholderiales bacterium]
MMSEEARNISIIVGGSIGMFLVLIGGFVILCTLSWAIQWCMDWGFNQLGFGPRFGNEQGPAGLEILIGAFLLLSLRRLSRIARPED